METVKFPVNPLESKLSSEKSDVALKFTSTPVANGISEKFHRRVVDPFALLVIVGSGKSSPLASLLELAL